MKAGMSVHLLMGVCGRSESFSFLIEIRRKAIHQGRVGRKLQLLEERSENMSEWSREIDEGSAGGLQGSTQSPQDLKRKSFFSTHV